MTDKLKQDPKKNKDEEEEEEEEEEEGEEEIEEEAEAEENEEDQEQEQDSSSQPDKNKGEVKVSFQEKSKKIPRTIQPQKLKTKPKENDEDEDEDEEEEDQDQDQENQKLPELQDKIKPKEQKEESQEEPEESESEKGDKSPKSADQEYEVDTTGSVASVSLDLIKKFMDINPNDSNSDLDKLIEEFLLSHGLALSTKDEETLALCLYFHKLCIPFYKMINSLGKKDVGKVFLSGLKKSYFLFMDEKCSHFNYKSIAKKTLSSLKTDPKEKPKLAIVFNKSPIKTDSSTSYGTFKIQKEILKLGMESNGRLDVYSKLHILKALISYVNIEKLTPYIKDFQTMENDLIKLYQNSSKEKIDEKKYDNYVGIFTNGEKRDEWLKTISSFKKSLSIFQYVNDFASVKILEKLCVQLLGHLDREVRSEAVKILNLIYDQTTWQDKSAFPLENTKIELLGQEINLELAINFNDYSEQSIVIILSSPSPNKNINYQVQTFLKAKSEDKENDIVKLKFSFGELKKCGYYDWYLVRFTKGRFLNVKIIDKNKKILDGKGRIIVLNKDIKNLSAHEVFCDLIDADIDQNQGKITKRGNFKSLEGKLEEFHKRLINCLYIMGTLERDNNIAYDENSGQAFDFANNDASPMAVTNRDSISTLLGGEKDFKSLVDKAKTLDIKIIIDSLSRVSSSRANRKYRNILLRYLDSHNKMQLCYGCDGKSVNYEDSTILNYRKIEAWDMLINEIKTIIDKFDIDGLHLENCQTWPQIMELDASEMLRIDNDGQPAYTPLEILNGEIVLPNSESGYWDSDACENYANPLLIKLTKTIWNDHPEFIFIGECWLNEKYSQRHVNLTKSGVIPRMYTLPIILCQILGKKILRDGRTESVQPENVSIIKEWYTDNYQNLPQGSILVQSSSGQVWPYPSLLYERGNWTAIDLLFALPDIPMTFMGEIDGEAYRVEITKVYEKKDMNNQLDDDNTNNNSIRLKSRSKSLMKLVEVKLLEQREREREGTVKSTMIRSGSLATMNDYLPQYNMNESILSIINLSGVSLEHAKDIDQKQSTLVNSLKKDDDFDLTKINSRYDQRREMRTIHQSLRNGKLVYLNAFDNNHKVHPGIFTFARMTPEETGIFAINFRDEETNFLLDLSGLLGNEENYNSICYIIDWTAKPGSQGEYYFLRELTQSHVNRKIGPYSTICFGFSIIPFSQETYMKTLERSNLRLIGELKSKEYRSIDNFHISLQLKEIIEKELPIEEFIKWFKYLSELLEKYNVDFNDYIKRLDFLKGKEKYITDFFRYCLVLANKKSLDEKNIRLIKTAAHIFNSNLLGPICFVTPELGRWSTVGGLGVMVDELSQGLKSIGQDIIMISPYYNQNRKGLTDYLANDPFNIHYTKNVIIHLDSTYQFGVHYGTGNDGIKYYFLHNAIIFPKPYPDSGPADIVRQMACFGKACLQLLCDLCVIPSIIVTNDWFTAFTPAYAKCGAFGDVFKGTTFMHICHNLEPSYEGRLYPLPQQGTLKEIYQFDPNWLIDPWWKKTIINPSRCAIMMSDQWSTVSNSYKHDLQTTSPLAPLLNQKPQPFAYPNGIFKERRLKQLLEKAGGDRVQCKKYIQQKYFGYNDADYTIPIYSFVGRLTQQKGVILILDAVEELVRKTNGKINILVGGMGNPNDPYVAACISKINYLKGKYPFSFWANPSEFFTDGPKINLGSDFGLMPSLFEPGGIVQHEFFIAGTPVIAYKTGGLKDTVFEYQFETNTGNGFTFETYNSRELVQAIQRSLDLFKNKERYELCRKNAKNSAIDVADVSRAWCKEFYRLKDKIFFNVKDAKSGVDEMKNNIDINSFDDKKNENDEKNKEQLDNDKKKEEDLPQKEKIDDGLIPITFTYQFDKGKQPNTVLLSGSFNNWTVKHNLVLDPLSNSWSITLRLAKGKYFYKYIIDNVWLINPQKPSFRGQDGFENNVIEI